MTVIGKMGFKRFFFDTYLCVFAMMVQWFGVSVKVLVTPSKIIGVARVFRRRYFIWRFPSIRSMSMAVEMTIFRSGRGDTLYRSCHFFCLVFCSLVLKRAGLWTVLCGGQLRVIYKWTWMQGTIRVSTLRWWRIYGRDDRVINRQYQISFLF